MAKDLHDLVSRIKDLALELGRTPTSLEFYKVESQHAVKVGGGYTALVNAAGLDPVKRMKIDNTIFEKNIDRHVEEYEPREDIKPYVIKFENAKIAFISDIHWPFHSQKVLDKFYEFIEEHQPNFVVINGDAWDMYSHSKYPKSSNIFMPREEESLARKHNEEFWKKVQKLCKNVRCFQLLGNHDIRPLKRVIEEYPAAEDWVQGHFKKLFSFDGVETIFDYRQELIINDDAIFHGYRSKLGDHRDYTHMNCHVGHTHFGGTVFRRIGKKTMFECNSGVAGDIESKGLAYTPQKMTHQTPGFAYRDKWGPRFIPV